MPSISPEDIDQLLPQTQCGLCGYGGCMPYAEALVFEHAPINLCPPGGIKVLTALAKLLQQDATPFISEMEKKAKPAQLAEVREAECIGCTKCIQACPVDAILGSAKQMHTVIANECTGCELCVPACPVDCIDILSVPEPNQEKAHQYRGRFLAREKRLQEEKTTKEAAKLNSTLIHKKAYIAAAIARAKAKKK